MRNERSRDEVIEKDSVGFLRCVYCDLDECGVTAID